jgi:formylglycine-generating enzyme required for sulfatase activity
LLIGSARLHAIGGWSNSARVLLGGSWNNNASNVRSAIRNHNDPTNSNNNVGFRVAKALQRKP